MLVQYPAYSFSGNKELRNQQLQYFFIALFSVVAVIEIPCQQTFVAPGQ